MKKVKIPNFRDLGGLKCKKRKIVNGKIFRSTKLYGLSRREKKYIDSLNLDKIIDFRSKEEFEEKPDYVPSGCKLIEAQVFDGKEFKYIIVTRKTKLAVSALRGNRIGKLIKNKQDSYSAMALSDAFTEIFNCMDKGETFLFHCTEGKDRTGIAAALIEYCLGRSEEQIRSEYLLSNTLKPPKNRQHLRYLGIPQKLIDDISYCESTHEELLDIFLNSVNESYGSIDNYLLKKFNVTEERKRAWKRMYTKRAII